MILELKLAYRNLMSRGLRTWLNIIILSVIYVLIIAHQGIFTGMLKQGMHAMIKDDVSGGQYWVLTYDPYDPFTFDDSHGIIPKNLKQLLVNGDALPILLRPASIYPEGRVQSVLLRGVLPHQNVIDVPSESLIMTQKDKEEEVLKIFVGKRMAKKNSLHIGDYITIRLRDAQGTFDAVDAIVVQIMNTTVPTIDNNQIWMSLENLQKLTGLKNEATIITIKENVDCSRNMEGWVFKDQAFLIKDITDMVKSKRIGGIIMYAILLFLALLAIFDTQVLSIFKRRKEIGILMALGMKRIRVIEVFTLEGVLNGVVAALIAPIYGVPLLTLFAKHGMKLPDVIDSYGFALTARLFPSYSIGLVLLTVFIVMISVTIVSFLPTRKISKLKPTEALRGKK